MYCTNLPTYLNVLSEDKKCVCNANVGVISWGQGGGIGGRPLYRFPNE